MKKMIILRLLLVVALGALLVTGCAKKPAPAPEAPVEQPAEAPAGMTGMQDGSMTEAPVSESASQVDAVVATLQRIFFEFDQYTLTDEARATLAGNAAYLKANSSVRLRIEGHCDERGSDEYNLALGERRAMAAKTYLETLGVEATRLSIISYGEEMALDPGHGEEAWAKNRRAEFKPLR